MTAASLSSLIILSLIFLPLNAKGNILKGDNYSSDTFIQSEYIYNINKDINTDPMNHDEEVENPFRRFEITFLISLPFLFLTNFIALHIYEVIKQRDPEVSVWEEHG